MRRISLAATTVLFLALGACGGKGPTAPTSHSPATSVEVGVSGGADPVVAPGGTLQLWARTHNEDGGTTDITNVAIWQSSDPSIASVSRDGIVRAAKVGPATISATFSKYSGTLALTIVGCLATAPARIAFKAIGGTATLPVALSGSDCRWAASSSDPGWLQVYLTPPSSGSGSVSYSVSLNNTGDTRTGNITIDVPGGRGATVTIVQDKPSCVLALSPSSRTVPASGGAFTVDLTATPDSCEWTVNAYEGGNLKITGPRSGRGNATIAYTVAPNTFTYSPYYTIEVWPLLRDMPPTLHTIQQLR